MSGAQKNLLKVQRAVVSILQNADCPMNSLELLSRIRTEPPLLFKALLELQKKGILKKVYTQDYDYNRPFDTVSWTIKDRQKAESFLAEEPFETAIEEHFEDTGSRTAIEESKIQLVLSIPLSMHKRRGEILDLYNAVDFFDAYREVVESTEKELKIMSPFIDAYALYPVVDKISKSSSLSVLILTEKDNLAKEFDAVHLLAVMKGGGLNIKVRDAKIVAESNIMDDVRELLGKESRNYKTSGIHAKIIIADTAVALVGSFNFTRFHYLSNFDVGFLIYDRSTVKTLSDLFEEMWKNGKPIFRETL